MSVQIEDVLRAIAPNRSTDSWLAGSAVIAQFLERKPNDVDIHHLKKHSMEEARRRDTEIMAGLGFHPEWCRASTNEYECRFTRMHEWIVLNWVLEDERPASLISDPNIGIRASYATVIARKIAMYQTGRDSKHLEDLLNLQRNECSMKAEIAVGDLRSQLEALGIEF